MQIPFPPFEKGVFNLNWVLRRPTYEFLRPQFLKNRGGGLPQRAVSRRIFFGLYCNTYNITTKNILGGNAFHVAKILAKKVALCWGGGGKILRIPFSDSTTFQVCFNANLLMMLISLKKYFYLTKNKTLLKCL